ncbi:SprT-like domain-containing protein [Verrucomicrobiaceae bacterium E54]|nr:SprT-like domain-containing protein [Verrucomicrobiaceae bacterium E54]
MLDERWTGLAVDAARTLGLSRLAGRLRVEWNPRLRTSAGRAWSRQARIELNPLLKNFDEEEIRRTLLHELAHLVAHNRAGRRKIAPHGPEWQLACAELGIPGEPARHQLPLPRIRQQRRFTYACPACGKVVRRARRLRHEAACLPCCRQHAGGRFDRRFLLVATTG